jgi:CubicO group peptidase (beta-lactamase class C family)
MTRTQAALPEMDQAIRSGGFGKITSVLVARDGELRHEFYADGVTAATQHNTRSATKTVAGMLIGIAIDQGLIAGVDEPVLPLLAGRRPAASPDPRKDAVTLADLLTMSSAWQCNDFDPDSPGNEELMYDTEDWVQFALDLPVRPGAPDPAAPRPARQFSYCTAGVGVLGEVLVRAAGRPVQEFAHETLFGPLGIAGEQWKVNPAGVAFGLELTSADLLKLGQLYLGGGSWHGRRLISAHWVAESVTEQARVDDQTGYGYLWWLRSLAPAGGGGQLPSYQMQGNGGSKVAVFPAAGLVAVLTSTNYNTPGMHQQTERLLTDYILPALG